VLGAHELVRMLAVLEIIDRDDRSGGLLIGQRFLARL
jgi:hypothetical protein